MCVKEVDGLPKTRQTIETTAVSDRGGQQRHSNLDATSADLRTHATVPSEAQCSGQTPSRRDEGSEALEQSDVLETSGVRDTRIRCE